MPEQRDDWNAVSVDLLKNPHSLRLWQSLVHCAESQSGLINRNLNQVEVLILRKSYAAFLERYPFQLKYWMAYALWERKLNNNEEAERIFLRALQFGSYDVTLWVTYLKFKIETPTNKIDDILQLFEAARVKIGYHYQSFEFYQLYLTFLDTYADTVSKFRKKRILLLRIMLEIPLYNYSASYEQILRFISSSSSTFENLSFFMHSTDLSALKRLSQNNKKLVQEDIENLLAKAYVVTQAKSFELYSYERLLTRNSPATMNQLEVWDNYLSVVESSYPFDYVAQLYERCLLQTDHNHKIVLKYFNFCIHNEKLGKARNVLRMAMSTADRSASVQQLLRLSDLEIAMGNILSAKDMIRRYILLNNSVSDCIFAKLMDIEALLNFDDEKYLCTLAHEMMHTTKSPSFLEKLCHFPISQLTLNKYFLNFVKKPLKDNFADLAEVLDLNGIEFLWKTIKKISNESDIKDIDFP